MKRAIASKHSRRARHWANCSDYPGLFLSGLDTASVSVVECPPNEKPQSFSKRGVYVRIRSYATVQPACVPGTYQAPESSDYYFFFRSERHAKQAIDDSIP